MIIKENDTVAYRSTNGKNHGIGKVLKIRNLGHGFIGYFILMEDGKERAFSTHEIHGIAQIHTGVRVIPCRNTDGTFEYIEMEEQRDFPTYKTI